MNNDLPIRFKKIEEIEARKSFDPDSVISTENFKDLLGYYKNFPKKVKCQVLKTNNPCNRGHQEGFLGLMSDGTEALIGIDCGDK